MADTHETIADIIAKKRRRADELEASSYRPHQFLRERIAELRQEADRLDAAHKRELAVYVLAIAKLRGALVKCRDIALLWQVDEAAGVAGTTDKPHARSAAEAMIDIEFEINAALFATATAEKLSAVGDAAKLREALKAIVGLCAGLMPTWDGAIGRIKDIAEAALSAPPRNCDKYATADEALKAQEQMFNDSNFANGECKLGCPECDNPRVGCKIAWLFAPATENEGGAK